MLQEAKDVQNRAVADLVRSVGKQKETTFKAPTGSGKTYMMAKMMDNIIAANSNIVFLVSSLSKGDLAEQNYLAFEQYKSSGLFPHIDAYLINTEMTTEERLHIPESHNVYVLPRDLYKKGGRLMQGAMEGFLQKLTQGAITGGLGKSIYLIKDECHIQTKNLDNLSNKYFAKIFNFSATPKLSRGQSPTVEITDAEAVNSRLIKSVTWGNDSDSLEDAVKAYCELKEEYIEKLSVNPCLIIQISNKDKAEEEMRDLILPVLNRHDIQWMYIVDKDKECRTNTDLKKHPVRLWKKYAKEDLSPVEVIIFKLAISEGWDIRRACMLYQIRDTQSKQLDEQVLGRVRRNPRLLDFEKLPEDAQALATTAWAWGIRPAGSTRSINVDLKPGMIQSEVKIKTTILKDLKDKAGFDIDDIIARSPRTTAESIFDLYHRYQATNNDIQQMCDVFATSYEKWFDFCECLPEITREYNAKICDYKESMRLAKDTEGNVVETSFPAESLYNETPDYIIISNNVWKRRDGDDSFSFDSQAEREWADILKDLAPRAAKEDSSTVLGTYLWGKNYLYGSAIKYEYYLDGTHSSYPDFILKDKYDQIHLFEVKSVNSSGYTPFDPEAYREKIAALKECYTQASLLTGHIFYLPIKKGSGWEIFRMKAGAQETLTKEQFRDCIENNR